MYQTTDGVGCLSRYVVHYLSFYTFVYFIVLRVAIDLVQYNVHFLHPYCIFPWANLLPIVCDNKKIYVDTWVTYVNW